MMGQLKRQPELFSYAINLEKRVRSDHPLRRVLELADFSFVRGEVEHLYGDNGKESVPPEVILKLLFLLFLDNIASERELMRMIPERLDYLWFLGYQIDEEIPDHSVLSKARARWGREVFESFFLRVVRQCVAAGLVEGRTIHLDGSLIDAHASTNSVLKAGPQLIALIQNVRILLRYSRLDPAVSLVQPVFGAFYRCFFVCKAKFGGLTTLLHGSRLELLADSRRGEITGDQAKTALPVSRKTAFGQHALYYLLRWLAESPLTGVVLRGQPIVEWRPSCL